MPSQEQSDAVLVRSCVLSKTIFLVLLVRKLTIPKLNLTNKQKALIVGLLAVGALLWLWFGKTGTILPMKHITTVVEQHKAEVKDLEKNIEKLRQENDKPVARSSLDIDRRLLKMI